MRDIRDFTPVPTIISIVSVKEISIWKRPFTSIFSSDLLKDKFLLTPYCEYEQGVHETDYNGKPYHLEFAIPKYWWDKNAPKVGLLFDILRVGLTVAAACSQISNPALWLAMAPAIATIEKLFNLANGFKIDISKSAKVLPAFAEVKKNVAYDLFAFRGEDRDSELRHARLQLAELLKEIAPNEYNLQQWGELRRVRMGDNTHRWLCKQHAAEYRSKF